MLAVVVDTNVFVSGLLRDSPPRFVLKAWRDGRFRLLTSIPLLEELASVLARPKFARHFTAADSASLTRLVDELAIVAAAAFVRTRGGRGVGERAGRRPFSSFRVPQRGRGAGMNHAAAEAAAGPGFWPQSVVKYACLQKRLDTLGILPASRNETNGNRHPARSRIPG